MNEVKIKQEHTEPLNNTNNTTESSKPNDGSSLSVPVIELDSSEEEDDTSSSGKRARVLKGGDEVSYSKRRKDVNVNLPEGFLDPLPSTLRRGEGKRRCRQFWKAGEFDGGLGGDRTHLSACSGGMDHLRVHPRFLHSNATSHKWVLGAFAELLDNSLDESSSGATYVNIDMLTNKKDNSRILLIEDNGGGMDPEKMRYCMSLGFSLKSKVADTIGQYGNGFKTSTMRLGADVIVFSRCSGKNGKMSTQSIGLLSYTFLWSTGQEDILVPMLDYEKSGKEWNQMKRSSAGDWDTNVETMVQWSPFSSEADLLKQFDHMKDQGTRIIIYNLWEDDQGNLELDFDTDNHDIQMRGVNREEKNIEMAQQYPNSRHYLTYRHSLRSYASILYLRVPLHFRMILRGKDVEHHNIINDMMMTKVVTYRPHPNLEGAPTDSNIVAVVTVGFVKDAKAHIDVQGFNVYHKNRLIKPFWRIWNAASSDGRGVIGLLEADFVEPAHDKQGFERTTVLQRLEARLLQMQKTYWRTFCHKVGYNRIYKAGYIPKRHGETFEYRELSPEHTPELSARKSSRTRTVPKPFEFSSHKPRKESVITKPNRPPTATTNERSPEHTPEPSTNKNLRMRPTPQPAKFSSYQPQKEAVITKPNRPPTATTNSNINDGEKRDKPNRVSESTSPLTENTCVDLQTLMNERYANARKTRQLSDLEVRYPVLSPNTNATQVVTPPHETSAGVNGNGTNLANSSSPSLDLLMEENHELKERLGKREDEILGDLMQDLKSEKNRSNELEAQLEEEKQKNEELRKEQDSIIAIFSEERERRDVEEEILRKKLKEVESANKDLMEKLRQLESKKRMGKWGQ